MAIPHPSPKKIPLIGAKKYPSIIPIEILWHQFCFQNKTYRLCFCTYKKVTWQYFDSYSKLKNKKKPSYKQPNLTVIYVKKTFLYELLLAKYLVLIYTPRKKQRCIVILGIKTNS